LIKLLFLKRIRWNQKLSSRLCKIFNGTWTLALTKTSFILTFEIIVFLWRRRHIFILLVIMLFILWLFPLKIRIFYRYFI